MDRAVPFPPFFPRFSMHDGAGMAGVVEDVAWRLSARCRLVTVIASLTRYYHLVDKERQASRTGIYIWKSLLTMYVQPK